MDLRELRIERMPGIDRPFRIEARPGLNLILGPNGSGKSSLCRAALGLLWPGRHTGAVVSATWDDGGVTWHAERTGGEHVAWQRDGQAHPGPRVPAVSQAPAFHLGVLDLLKTDADGDDRDLADAVRRQLAGGYDLKPEAVPQRPGQKEKKDLDDARRDVERCRADQAELQRLEAGLDELRRRRAAARQAADQARILDLVRDLRLARDEHVSLRRQLETGFPATMHRLQADDLPRLRRLRQTEHGILQELAIARRQRAEAEEQQRQQGFDGAPPAADLLTGLRRMQSRTERLQQDLDELQGDLAGAEAAVAAAAAALSAWGEPPTGQPLDPAALRAEAAAAQELLACTARRDGLQQLRDLAAVVPEDGDHPDPQAVQAAREAALDWLAADDERRPPWLAMVAGTGLAVVGALARPWAQGDPLSWWPLGLAAVVLGLAVVTTLWRPRTRRAQARHAATGIEAPGRWDEPGIRRHLEQLAVWHEAHLDAGQRRRLADDLDRSRRQAEQELAEAAAGSPETDPVQRLDQAERLHRAAAYHQACRDRDEVQGRLEQRRRELEAALAEAARQLAPWQPDPDAAAATPQSLGAAIEALGLRVQRYDEATGRAEAAARRADDLDQRSRNEQAAAAELLAVHGVGPEDDDALRKLVDRLPAYEELAADAQRAATTVQLRETELADLPPDHRALADEALTLTDDELADQLDEAHLLGDSKDALQDQIVAIETRLQEAYRRSDLDQALRREAEARDRLAAVRERTREATLRHLLLDNLQQQHRRMAEPPVVARTRDLLLGFTHGAYEFLLPDDEDAVFLARDTRTGQGLRLSQLSDGTRAQLLLAARLAHVTDHLLPLFLDESLTASDPGRFHAVADAVLDLVAAGRQVFYLTCDPADVAAWQTRLQGRGLPAAPEVDLAAVRALPATPSPERRRQPATPPPQPHPDEPAADYAARLGVPPLAAHDPADAAHVFHLLGDRLPLVHALLCRGLQTVGQLRALGPMLVDDGLLDAEELASIQARIRALSRFRDGFVVGRGRPVPRGELAGRSGIKTRMLEQADDLLADLDGDAAAFMAALDARRIRNLNQSKQDEMADWLQAEGYLDPRPRLSQAALLEQVLQGVRDDVGGGRLSMTTVNCLTASWWAAAGGDAGRG